MFVCVCILVTLLDTRTVPGELKWAASPLEGGVSGSSSSFTDTLFTTCSPFGKTHSYRSLTHSHTLGLETVKNHPTDFEMCCCSPSLSANMRSLALCLAHKKAYTSLVVGVIFKGFLLPCSCQNESWKYLFYIISPHLFVLFVGTL